MTGPLTPDSTIGEPPRPRRWISVSFWIFVALLALFGIGGPLLSSWNRWTLDRFLNYARDGDISKCRSMLAEDHSTVWLLDEQTLQAAADEPLLSEPVSPVDFLLGRRTYRVNMAYSNDHSFTVSGGRVTLGSAFWLLAAVPEFRLTRQVQAIEEYKRRQQRGEPDAETAH